MDCTVTILGSPTSSAVVVQPAAELKRPGGEPVQGTAVVRLEETFLRSAGDAITVGSDRLLDLQLSNAVVATEGSLLHAQGSSQLDRSKTALNVRIENSLARTKAGLVYLESTLDEAELPLTEIFADNSIVGTAGPAALFRVNKRQGQMEGLRDRIIWKAEKVAYDQITTYRRDQILQTGVSPRDYTRADWRTTFDPKDESPVVDGVKFLHPLEPGRSATSLTRDDLRLDPESPAANRGPDLTRIPAPPAVES